MTNYNLKTNNSYAFGLAVLKEILIQNPHIQRGADMTAPLAMVKNDGTLDNFGDSFDEGHSKVVQAETSKIKNPFNLSENNLTISKDAKFIHFYQAFVVDSLLNKIPGDTTEVIDPSTFEIVEMRIGEDTISAGAYGVFRYGLS